MSRSRKRRADEGGYSFDSPEEPFGLVDEFEREVAHFGDDDEVAPANPDFVRFGYSFLDEDVIGDEDADPGDFSDDDVEVPFGDVPEDDEPDDPDFTIL